VNTKSQKQLDALAKDFAQAEAWLIALVNRVLIEGKLGSLRARRRASNDASAILDQLRGLTEKKAADLVKSSYLAGREVSGVTNKSLAEADRQSLQLLIDNLGGRLEDSTTIVGRRVDDVFRREGLRATALAISGPGVVDEKSVTAFRKRLLKEGATAFVDATGRTWHLETYARMALKTTMMEAVNTGAENLIRERGFDIIEIGHLGKYEPDPICDVHHGKKYSLTGRAKDFPLFGPTDKPPYHPNCEHYIKLAREATAERRRALRAA
jgi:hypothetical protein